MGILSSIKIAALLLLISAIAAAGWYYKWSQAEISNLQTNNLQLTLAVESSENALNAIRIGIVEVTKVNKAVNRKFAKTRKDNARLKNLLSKHNLGFLASKKPKLIQARINAGSNNSMRCFEIASGAPLTDTEINATKPSEINTACPDLANPNFLRVTK